MRQQKIKRDSDRVASRLVSLHNIYRHWQSDRAFLRLFLLPPHLRHRVIPASDDLATIVDNCNARPATVGVYLSIAPHILPRLHNDCALLALVAVLLAIQGSRKL